MLKSLELQGGKVLWVERCNLFINQYKWAQRLFASCMTGAVVLERVDQRDNYEKLKTQSSISWIDWRLRAAVYHQPTLEVPIEGCL